MNSTKSEKTTTHDAGLPLFNWLTHRATGVLLHPTSLPGDQGIGTFEPAPMERFLDFLSASGIRYWQVCPLGPTGYGDSPYQCFSAFAGNPYLIDLKALVRLGLLPSGDLDVLGYLDTERVNFGRLWEIKWGLLRKAYDTYKQLKQPTLPYGDFEAFKKEHASWLEPYSYFRALKDHFRGAPWWEWPLDTRLYKNALKSQLLARVGDDAEAQAFYQFLFFGQWKQVLKATAEHGIEVIGDLPIFVALDSADTWSSPQLFELDENTGRPTAVAGVPPDYFSSEGQLWGNPLYRWEAHSADNYAWWKARLKASFEMCSIVRIDHFRAFDEYWRIPADAKTARNGKWCPGPGLAFFGSLRAAFPDAKIIAEDLGEIGPSVRKLRDQAGLPGMAILQFAFGGDADNLYLPHNHIANSIVYPGTHDNDTTLGWYEATTEKARDQVRRYLRVGGNEIGWDFIRSAYSSVARLAILPLQDLLSLGREGRLNTPGLAQGNWQWRYRNQDFDKLCANSSRYLNDLGKLYDRCPPEKQPAPRVVHP